MQCGSHPRWSSILEDDFGKLVQRRAAAAVKVDFGTMQWTPLRTSTTWLMRQSATSEASE